MAKENMIFMGTDALLKATEVTDADSGDLINVATITGSIFSGATRHPISVLRFTSGGVLAIIPGDIITGATGGATAVVSAVNVTAGNWAAGTATGQLEISGQAGLFESENLNVTGQNNIATIPSNSTGLQVVRLGGGQVKIPMGTVGLSQGDFIRIESSKKYDGQYDIDAVDVNSTGEVQTSTLGALMTGGTFTLSYKGETTAAIAFNATIAQIVTALELLSTVGAGDITPEALHEPDTELTCTWTFLATLGDVPMLFMDISGATMAVKTVVWAETTKGGQSGWVTITAPNRMEILTGNEVIYIGIAGGKDIAFTHGGGDADGYYDGVQPDTLEGVYEDQMYYIFQKLINGAATCLHRYHWPAGYYSNDS